MPFAYHLVWLGLPCFALSYLANFNKQMKLYRTLERGCHQYYSSKIEAKRNARKAYKYYTENGEDAHSDEEIESVDIPLTKKALIRWLNDNAYYTGWTTD